MTNQLETEYQIYLSHLDEFISKHLNEFVLIKGDEIIDFYKSYKDSLQDGYRRFGHAPFFVKLIAKEEEVHFFHHGLA